LPKKLTRADELRAVAEEFQNACIALATGGGSYEAWEVARAALLSQPEFLRVIPDWVSRCRFGGQFWPLMKSTSSTYQGRREFLYASLAPLFDTAERGASIPTVEAVQRLLKSCNSRTVSEAWARIQARREADPEGAITAARALLESTCKHVLDVMNVDYGASEELPALYGKAAAAMNLAPQNHTEQVFKQIMSGCISVVSGLAAMRNALGDAHGKAAKSPRPSARHADLAINLAGTLSSFLIETYEERFRPK
jgi:hypothetical protein